MTAITNAFRQGDLVASLEIPSTALITEVHDSGRFSAVIIKTSNVNYHVGEVRNNLWDYEWELAKSITLQGNELAVGDVVQVRRDLGSPQKSIVIITDFIDMGAGFDFAGVVLWDTNPLNIGYSSQYYRSGSWERIDGEITLGNRYPGVGAIVKHNIGGFEVVITKTDNVYFDGVRISGDASGQPITGQEFHSYTLTPPRE